MRLPNPPAPILSPTGRHAAVLEGSLAAIVDTADARRVDVVLPANGQGAAISRDDRTVALCAGGEAAVTPVHDPCWPEQGRAALAGGVFRLALGRRTLVAALRTGEYSMSLCAWRIEDG